MAVRVRPWPLELVNQAPLDPDLVAGEIADLRDQISPELFSGFDPARFPRSSLGPLALVETAYAASLAQGERLSLSLRDAIFEHGIDVSDPQVLADIADSEGLALPGDVGEVVAAWHGGQARKVMGSPHFFCGPRDAFCPSLAITKAGGHLLATDNAGSLAAFLRECLAGDDL